MEDVCSSVEVTEDTVLREINNIFKDLKFQNQQSRTGKLWVQFMDTVEIVRLFIRAERTGDWHLHLFATELMMPYYAAVGHNHYTKATAKYLEDATNLCTCLAEKYEAGLFTITRNDKLFWSGTFTDQVIEQSLMRSGKTQGGLINITHPEAARTKWTLSSHIMAEYAEALRILTGNFQGSNEQHKEMNPNRRKENCFHMTKFIEFLQSNNPFNHHANSLVNVASGVVASSVVNADMALETGKKIVNQLNGMKVSEVHLKKKDQVVTFASMTKSIPVDDKNVRVPSAQLYQRLLANVKCGRATSEMFSYECSPVAPAFFYDNGQMRKNNKAELMAELVKGHKEDNINVSACHIFDGCAYFYKLTWPVIGTMFDVAGSFIRLVNEECIDAVDITVVFDNYDVETTKKQEQDRRNPNRSPDIVINRNTPVPTSKNDILSNPRNKQQLINLLSVALTDAGITVKHAEDGDADTLIVSEALRQQSEGTVIVHGHDTDLFICLLYHVSSSNNVIMTTKKGPFSITNIKRSLCSDIIKHLPFAHAMSGCDTVSATHGIGKTRAFKALEKSKSLRKLVSIIGEADKPIENVIDAGEKFLIHLYGHFGRQVDSLDQLREIFCKLPKFIPVERLPPTSRSFRFFLLRVHLQVNTWIKLKMMLNPLDYGFVNDGTDGVKAIITDKPVAPVELIRDAKCTCHVRSKKGELCNTCGCTKKGFPCSALCGCGGDCDNPS